MFRSVSARCAGLAPVANSSAVASAIAVVAQHGNAITCGVDDHEVGLAITDEIPALDAEWVGTNRVIRVFESEVLG